MTWPTGNNPQSASVVLRPTLGVPFLIALHMTMSRALGSKLPRVIAALGKPTLASPRKFSMAASTRAFWASKALVLQLAVDGPRSVALTGRMMPPGSACLGVTRLLTCMPVDLAVSRRAMSSVCFVENARFA